jgi:hypothetical protein
MMQRPPSRPGLIDHFYAMPSFWSGFGRVVDLGAQFDDFNWGDDLHTAAALAIQADFLAVHDAIQEARSRFECEHEGTSGPEASSAGTD